MARSRVAAGKDSVRASGTPHSRLVDDTSRNKTARQAQLKNHWCQKLVLDDKLDNKRHLLDYRKVSHTTALVA